jgi:hypothetical protein
MLGLKRGQQLTGSERQSPTTKAQAQGMKVLVEIISGFLVVVFVTLGSIAIAGTLEAITWGPPERTWSFRLLIGLVEIAGAVMLFIPRYGVLGAAGLATMMVGNVLRDLTEQHPLKAVPPILLTLLLIVVGYARRPPGLWPRSGHDDPWLSERAEEVRACIYSLAAAVSFPTVSQ